MSDLSLEELHTFASRIGLKRCWFQGVQKSHPHYDLTTEVNRQLAVNAGARLVTSRELLLRCRKEGQAGSVTL